MRIEVVDAGSIPRLVVWLALLFLLDATTELAGQAHAAPLKTRNVVVVTIDGFRLQEFFGGADEALINKDFGGVKEITRIKQDYLRSTVHERRAALLPFIWGTIAAKGQIFGDLAQGAKMQVTNGLKFSYPGYSEMFCGVADSRIRSNQKVDNPNLSVLEYLNGRPGFQGRVAAFCTWDVFPSIFRSSQNGLKVHTGWTPIVESPLSPSEQAANQRMATLPRLWADNALDLVTMEAAQEHLLRHQPRVLFIGLGETDAWGHGRRYDLYLDAAKSSDRFLAGLWERLQSLEAYRDCTTLLVITDHGRGPTRHDWTDHGEKVPDAEFIWFAALGPDVPARGVRQNVEATQSQLASTIAQFVGEDFRSAVPAAAAPLPILSGGE